MGWFSSLFGRCDIAADLLNPLREKQLREFAVVEDDPAYTKHYFGFSNSEGEIESFIVVYQRMNGRLIYTRTHGELPGVWLGFLTLNERSPWSMTISRLIELGQQLAPTTRPVRGHLAANVPPEELTKETARPAPRTSAPPRETKLSKQVDPGSWQITRQERTIDGPPPREEELNRTYRFFGASSATSPGASLRFSLTLEADADQSTTQGVVLNRRLRLYLSPFRLPHEAPFVMHLITSDQRINKRFEVLGAPLDTGSDTAVFARFGAATDVASMINILSAGQEIRFMLEDETESLVQFGLPNDREFKRLYDESCNRLTSGQAGYSTLRSQIIQAREPTFSELADRVRKNPKSYGIWMAEARPGEFSVLLVLLDGSGKNMADAWTLNTFNNRREQGAFGLDVARDLRIPLSDVVKNQ